MAGARSMRSERWVCNKLKLSIVVSTQPASFSALAYKGRVAENIKKVRDLGYDGVELAIRNPDLLNINELQKIISKTGLLVPAIGTGQAYGEEGLSFTHPDAVVRDKAIERIKAQIRLAESMNAIVIIGLIRGKREEKTDDKQTESWLLDALKICATENGSVKIAIEPLNRYESDLVNTVADGLELIGKLNLKNIGLLLDTFHMNIEEPSIRESIRLSKDNLFHFHVADSNRWYPGAGHIDFDRILTVLDEISYQGFVSAEILPFPDPDTAAIKTIKYLRALRS